MAAVEQRATPSLRRKDAATAVLGRARLGPMARKRERTFYLLISPWIVGFLAFVLGPMVYSGYLSLTQWNLLNPPQFVGFNNYRALVHDPLFWQSLKVTSIYALASVPLTLAFGLFLAILLNQRIRALSLFRTIVYLPSVVSGVAVAEVFIWVFQPQFGILNVVLSYFGIRGPGWISSPTWALPALILMSMYTVGGVMIIFLAGLQNVPQDLLEAASLDGASRWRRFWSIVIPMLSPTILFNLIISIINQFQTFTQAYVMTQGGPLYSTLFYVYYLFENAFQYLNFGYAAAMAWVLFAIVLGLTMLVLATSVRWVFYQGE